MAMLTLHLAKATPEALVALYKRLTGRDDLSVEEVRAALEKPSTPPSIRESQPEPPEEK